MQSIPRLIGRSFLCPKRRSAQLVLLAAAALTSTGCTRPENKAQCDSGKVPVGGTCAALCSQDSDCGEGERCVDVMYCASTTQSDNTDQVSAECAVLDCAAQERLCQAGSSGAWECGDCLADYAKDEQGSCVRQEANNGNADVGDSVGDGDGDGILDGGDACRSSEPGWLSDASTDHDTDGCRDPGEDADDDNDGVLDTNDSCHTGETGWSASTLTDADGDGCRDFTEDTCRYRPDSTCSTLPLRGGNGGGDFGNPICPPGNVAVGYEIRQHANKCAMTEVWLVCRELLSDGRSLGVHTMVGHAAGNTDGVTIALRCDQQGGIMIGHLAYTANCSYIGPGTMLVSGLVPICAALSDNHVFVVGEPAAGTEFVDQCPSGQSPIGIRGRAGALFDALSLQCGPM